MPGRLGGGGGGAGLEPLVADTPQYTRPRPPHPSTHQGPRGQRSASAPLQVGKAFLDTVNKCHMVHVDGIDGVAQHWEVLLEVKLLLVGDMHDGKEACAPGEAWQCVARHKLQCIVAIWSTCLLHGMALEKKM